MFRLAINKFVVGAMRRTGNDALAICALLLATAGCTHNPYVLQGQVETMQQQQLGLAQRNDELNERAASLDRNNKELETLLAQTRQQSRLLEDQVAALRDQLGTANTQLAQATRQQQDTARRVKTLEASQQRRAEATITANNSLAQRMPRFAIEGVEVRTDGDVMRVELPGSRIFEPESARLQAEAGRLIDEVASQLMRAYPGHIIGVEGHTDSDPAAVGRWGSNHQLSVGRAMAVYDHLVARSGAQPGQLFVVGHGSNQPVVSNGTDGGRQRNRRVELVIYPETVAAR